MLFHWSSIADTEFTILNFISIFPGKFEKKTFFCSVFDNITLRELYLKKRQVSKKLFEKTCFGRGEYFALKELHSK
jgi:hypothetical protein